MKKTKTEWLLSIVFFIIGIILIGISFVVKNANDDFFKTAIQTKASIIDITSDYNYNTEDNEYNVFVKYYIDGKDYTSKLDSYSSSMNIGDEVDIYYNPSNPVEIKTNASSIAWIIVGAMGILFGLIGGVMIVSTIRKKSKFKNLKLTGYKIEANIIDVPYNRSYAVNDKNPLNIICEGNDNNGVKCTFKSENIWTDVRSLITQYSITTIPVYIDPANNKKYFVDITELDRYNNIK